MRSALTIYARAAVLLIATCAATSAWAQQQSALIDQISAETRVHKIEGPSMPEGRDVYVWRPPNAQGPLPVVYVADGPMGLLMVVTNLRAHISSGAAPPILVVATSAHTSRRLNEYAERGPLYRAHGEWMVTNVVPWAEQTQGASSDRTQRIIGGFSNGADLAIGLAGDHPETFGGVLALSPMYPYPGRRWVQSTADSQRWVVAGGSGEAAGRWAQQLERELGTRSANRRFCAGEWGHDVNIGAQLSPGAIMWLLGRDDASSAVSTELERSSCEVRAAR